MKKTAGTDATTETYKDVEITSYTSSDGSSSAYAVVGDYVFVGTTADDVKAFVDSSQPGADTLGSIAGFAKASELLPADRVAFAFLNGPVAVDASTKAAGNPSIADAIRQVFGTLAGYTGLAMTADDAGIRFESVIVPERGTGNAKPAGQAADLNFASQMPADTAVYASGFDLGRSMVMNALGLGVGLALMGVSGSATPTDTASPTPFSTDQIYESLALMFGFNLKTALLDQMTGPYGFGVWGTNATNMSDVNAVLFSGAKDATTSATRSARSRCSYRRPARVESTLRPSNCPAVRSTTSNSAVWLDGGDRLRCRRRPARARPERWCRNRAQGSVRYAGRHRHVQDRDVVPA